MIVRPKTGWFRMLFVWHNSVLKQMLPQLLIVLALSVVALWIEGKALTHRMPLNATPFSMVGVALALFLGFRNSSAYDRWWEGRRLWGTLLNETRALTRQVLTLTGEARDKRAFVDMLVAFTYATRDQLRGDTFARGAELLPPLLAAEVDRAKMKPMIILRALSAWMAERHREGAMGEITLAAMDQNVTALSDILGGCERIASTPVPFSYSVMIHRVVYFYCALLPFGLVDSIAWMTPLVSMVLAYSFIALELLAGELEMPFGREANGLALDAISRTIELSVREMSGEPLDAGPLEPVGYVLL